MDILQQKKSLDMLYDYFVRGKSDPSRIPYVPQKTAVPHRVRRTLPRATPEEKGIPSDRITALLHDLENSARVQMHALTVVCDGAVIAEAVAAPYDPTVPHLTHSMCKSVTSLAIGLLVDEGRLSLDTPAFRFFPTSALPARLSARMKTVTVRHLLTMSSGASFAETGAVTEADWVRAFFASECRFAPGSDFAYNSMNTYILSAIVKNLTGEGLVAYLRPRLFEPLGIREIFWERCPRGIEKGGWGLFIAQEDIAKIGMLCLAGGCTQDGRRLISEKYIREACTRQIGTPADAGDYDYGYQIWSSRKGHSFLFNGMLGQNTWICPQNRLVVVANAGDGEFFQKGGMLPLIERHLGASLARSATPLARDRAALRRLRRAEARFFQTRAWVRPRRRPGLFVRIERRLRGRPLLPLPSLCRQLDGRVFRLPPNNTGILPTFVRVMQNNYGGGLRELRLSCEGERFFCTFDEGEGNVYRIEVGFYGHVPALLDIRGEKYRIAAAGGFAVDEDGSRLLKLDIAFLELPHSRRVKIFFDEFGERVLLREVPGREVIDGLLRNMPVTFPKSKGVLQFIRNINLDYFFMKIYDKFEPNLVSLKEGEGLPPVAFPTDREDEP